MTSKSICIENTLKSINNGIIPGSFTTDRKKFVFPTLKYKNDKKNDLEWTIEVSLLNESEYIPIEDKMLDFPILNLNGYTAEINTISKQVGGKIRKNVPTIIATGKNIGKKNETNVITQAIRDALSLYNKQLSKISTECEDKPPPMLLQSINSSEDSILKESDFKNGITVQKKYNGVRYVTYIKNNNIIQYSRTGKDYHPSDNINKDLLKLFSNLPEMSADRYKIKQEDLIYYNSPYLDGELYEHGKPLNYISGQARKELKDPNLKYYIFDVFWPEAKRNNSDMLSKYRQKYLKDLFGKLKLEYVFKVDSIKVKNMEDLLKLSEQYVKDGYEGAIARKDNKGYYYSFNNYHSSNVLKVKPVYEKEFKVVGFTQGTKGKDLGKIIWICELDNPKDPNDNKFTVVPNLSLEDREKLFNHLSKTKGKKLETIFDSTVKGKMLTISYAELSEKTGKPLQPKAIVFRTYESGDDIIKKVYEEAGILSDKK